ncbi:MAG TPA: protein-glutamate O-methyltransferase [Dissulfurispiraceae bacterium]|nr:protein-glutamate O-methyltransferase [Dissulfurispiraceae bacterium]
MTNTALPSGMTDREFTDLSRHIYKVCGIKITTAKKVMLEARLAKRLKTLGMKTYKDYCCYLFSPAGCESELVHMIDVVTTNKTEFFRECAHFTFLTNSAVPQLIGNSMSGMRRSLMVWSAGCSTGEEPYTLAMVLKHLSGRTSDFDFMVLATDISTRVLESAKAAIYREESIGQIPDEMKKKYLLRGKADKSGLVRIAPEVREKVRFRRLNFMDGDFGMREPVDIIFCRNVIIYFDRQTQEVLLNRFCSHLSPGGYLFLGHSETIHNMSLPLSSVAPTVYRKQS